MDRNQPYYSLAKIKSLIQRGLYRISNAAFYGARLLGLNDEEAVVNVIVKLQGKDFYKSMESHRFSGTWQDVYRPLISGRMAYVKLQISAEKEAVIIQFKAKDFPNEGI
ncbi:MAG: type II toxin-antitoxin system MqsR family toxin [Deltaproteobacteria bacterium]|nr:type II toxin-antitoxin system MqsR family toxin [Deltaproteobacteria bacterium]